MPSGPKKRRAARRKRGSNTNHTEDEVEDAVEVSESLSNGDMKADQSHEHVEKSKDVPVVEECDSVGSNGKKESVHDEKIIMVESSDSVRNKEKASESEPVDQVLIQPSSKEIKGNKDGEVDDGFSVVKESEKNTKEGVLQDPFEESRVDTVDQVVPKALPLQEAQDVSVTTESVSEVNVDTFVEDAQDSLKELSVVHENEGVEVGESALVKDVSIVKNEGEDQDPYEETKESSSREFDQSILKNIHIKEADHIPTESAESVIEVDVDAISFEDAEDSFKTPLGSPSIGHMSQVIIPFNKAQEPYVDEVNVQRSLKEDQDSITEPHGVSSLVDVSPVEEIVQGIEVAEGGESASHVEPVLKVDEGTSKESVLEEELIEGSSHELVNSVIPLEEAQDSTEVNVETYSKDVKDSLEEVVKGNVCAIGECTCDCPLINYVVSEDEKMSFRGVSKDRFKEPNGNVSHDPQEMFDNIDMSRVEGFLRFNGHGNEPIGLSSHEQLDDVASVEGVVPGNECDEVGKSAFNHVLVLKEEEEMPIEGVLEEPNGGSSDEPQVIIKTLDQEIPGDSVSEANVETYLEDAEEYSLKVPLGISYFLVKENEYEEVGENEMLVNPFVLGIEEEEDDEDMSIDDGVLEEPLKEKPIETSSDELQAIMVKMVDNSDLEVMPLKDAEDPSVSIESLSEANVDTSLKDAQGSLKEPIRDSSMDNVLHHVDSVMKENEDMSMEDVLEEPISFSSDEPQPMVKRIDQDPSTQVAQDSFKVPLGDVQGNKFVEAGDQSESHGEDSFKDKGYESAAMVNQVELVMEENEEKSIEGVLEESFERSSNEPELIVKTVDQSILKEAQHPSLAEESDSVIDVLPIEAMVKGNEVAEVDETASEYSLQEPKAIIKTIAQFVLKGLHYKEDHDPSVLEVNEDTSSEDSQVSFETPLGSPSVGHVSPNEAFAQWNESTESIEENVESRLKDAKNSPIESSGSFSLVDLSYMEGIEENESAEVVSVLKDDKEVSMEGVLEECFEKKVGDSSHEQEAMVNTIDSVEVVSVLKDDKEVSMEGVLEEDFEKKVEDSSHEQEEMVNTIDRSLLKEKEAEDLSTPVESVTEVNVETSVKDSQDSLKEPMGIPSMDDVSPLEGVVQGNEFGEIGESEEISIEGVVQDPLEEPIGSSSQVLEEIVKTDDQLDLKEIHLKETQIPSLPDDSVIEVIKDVDSLKKPLRSSSQVDEGNECVEVGEIACHDSPDMVNHMVSVMKDYGEKSMEGVLQDPFKEPSGSSLHDHLTFEGLHLEEEVEDPSVLAGSVIKVNVDKSIEDAQDLYETPPGSPSVGHMDETLKPSLPVKSVIDASVEAPLKDDEDHSSMESLGSFSMADVSSMKSVVQGNESLQGNVQEKESTEGSENATMDNHVESLKKENEDLSLEDVLEVPFEKPFGDSSHEQKSTVESVIESPSLVDVFPVEGNEFNKVSEIACHDSPTMVNHVVNGPPVEGVGQRNGQRNEMVGLVRTLLEEIRRIRAFYEEGLRQTTKIDLQMLEILEKYDSTR